ncbi:MAG TPA: MFS transporter [Acidobacteriaceae bacterium]|nr:MFS transporter [Acidobacteriaceae bacterium]
MSAAASTASPPAAPVITTHPLLGVIGVLFGALVATCTGRLISVGLADLRGALHLGFDEGAWINTAFNAAQMFIGPFSVYLGGLLGPRRVLLACAAIFTVMSVLLPLAPNLPCLLTLLVIAGLTAGTFYPLTLSFVLRNLPMRYVLIGIAMYAMDIVFTTNVATSLEAWYMEHLSWHWIFWNSAVLTPIMMVLIYFGIPWQPLPAHKEGQPKPSWRGFLYASLGFSLLYIALDQGQRLNWFHSGVIVGLTASGVFLLLMTVVRHFSMPNPLVNLQFLLHRNTLLLGVVLIFFRFTILATVVIIPSYLGSVKGYLPLQTGPVLLWVGVPQCICGILGVFSLRYIDARLVLTLGFSLVAIACVMNSHLSSAWSGANFAGSQVVLALGLALAFNGLVGAIILEVVNSGALKRPIDVLTFAGYFQTVRLFGGEIGAAFLGRFIAVREQFHSNILGLGVQLGDPATYQRLLGLGAGAQSQSAGLPQAAGRAVDILGLQVRQQAFTLAITDSFMLIAFSAVCCLIVIACMAPVPTQFRQVVQA